MKIYTQIKKLAPICAVFAALAFTSCNKEEGGEETPETPPAEETSSGDAKGTE